jgi:hypothetical protein
MIFKRKVMHPCRPAFTLPMDLARFQSDPLAIKARRFDQLIGHTTKTIHLKEQYLCRFTLQSYFTDY